MLEDRLQRLDRLGVGEREQLAFVGETLLQRRHQVGGGNHDRGHRVEFIMLAQADDSATHLL